MAEETVFDRVQRVDDEMSRWTPVDPDSVRVSLDRFNATHRRVHGRLRRLLPSLGRTIAKIDAFRAAISEQALAQEGE